MPETFRPDTAIIFKLLEKEAWETVSTLLERMHPADIALLLEDVGTEHAVNIFRRLPVDIASEVLDETGALIRQELIEQVDDERLAILLDEMPMDDAANILDELPDRISDRLLGLMDHTEADEVREILAYEDDTVGRLMNRVVPALRRQWTVAHSLEYLRSLEEIETIHYLYVVDRNERLIGVVPIRYLILSQLDASIEDIMLQSVFSIQATADQEELAEFVARYDYVAIPVVDEDDRLIGVVTVDDVMDALEAEVTEDIQRMGGSEPLDQPYFSAGLRRVVSARIGWLMLLFVAAIMTGTVLKSFEKELQTVIALGFFIPLVTGTGGNAGSQTVATIIRAITLGEVRVATLGKAVLREIVVGLCLGFFMGVMGFALAFFWGVGWQLAAVVGLTLPVVVVCATTIATVVPTLATRFNIDPTIISGPMISTVVDTAGLAIYFLLARLLIDAI
ncbi:MAG: magnesium transporter [Candidatus Promineifilaceae bacterium]|jgi:magnesium transporter